MTLDIVIFHLLLCIICDGVAKTLLGFELAGIIDRTIHGTVKLMQGFICNDLHSYSSLKDVQYI